MSLPLARWWRLDRSPRPASAPPVWGTAKIQAVDAAGIVLGIRDACLREGSRQGLDDEVPGIPRRRTVLFAGIAGHHEYVRVGTFGAFISATY